MKRRNLVWSLSFFLGLVASSSAVCQTSDTFQRFIRFHNSLDRTINPTQSVIYAGAPPAVLTGPAQPRRSFVTRTPGRSRLASGPRFGSDHVE
ncbi:MAG TPA: hypothetical protein VKV24_13640 [Casimicrobiaceae bacterium]|nr:hypothetical protein [Casimicrobiaceae bacterium]